MNGFENLLFGTSVAHSVLLVSTVAAIGVAIGRAHWRGMGLGVVGVLFVGLAVARLHVGASEAVLDFLRDFGLILFVYSVGVQVGPGFLSSFKNQGWKLNVAAVAVVAMGALMAIGVHEVFRVPVPVVIGILAGATTNTPSLAAAQQLIGDLASQGVAPRAATILPGVGYAVAYPLGVVGVISSMLILRRIFGVNIREEAAAWSGATSASNANIAIRNRAVTGRALSTMEVFRSVIVTRRMRNDQVELGGPDTVLEEGDVIHVVGDAQQLERVRALVGAPSEVDLRKVPSKLTSRWVMVTARAVIGKSLAEVAVTRELNVQVTRLLRAGITLPHLADTRLQFGDVIMAVGEDDALVRVGRQLGDETFRDEQPQTLGLFVGIALGVLLGTIPLRIPGFPVPLKLGLAGGPLLVAMALSRVGRVGPFIWYLSPSARLMLRDLGIILFLACVGLKSGEGFFRALGSVSGWMWMGCGALVTVIPLLLGGLALRLMCGVNFVELCGFLSGSMTDPPALAFASGLTGSDGTATAYAAVYPLVMVLRVVAAQLLVVFLL